MCVRLGVVVGGRLTDWISLGVLASWVPADAVDDAVEAAEKGERRRYHRPGNTRPRTRSSRPSCAARGRSCARSPPDMIEQELWGYLLTHYTISALACTAATAAGIDSDRVRQKRTVRAVRRRVGDPAFPPDRRGSALDQVKAGITGPYNLSQRRERSYP